MSYDPTRAIRQIGGDDGLVEVETAAIYIAWLDLRTDAVGQKSGPHRGAGSVSCLLAAMRTN